MKKLITVMAALLLTGLVATVASASEDEKIAAYFYAPYADTAAVKKKLEEGGFEVVATYSPTKKSETVVVTCPGLKKLASKPGRGFGAVMRVLVDDEHRRVAYTNPVYFEKAFLQDDYDPAIVSKVRQKLVAALGKDGESPDAQEADDLAGYHFMMGMPYYEDVYELAEGKNEELLGKLEGYKGGKMVVFTLDLGNGSTLVGVDLDRRTKKFTKKIGTQNAEILPYTILIEDGKATALAAKYYLAVSYPLLSMGEFMTIATVPGAIEKELEKPFR